MNPSLHPNPLAKRILALSLFASVIACSQKAQPDPVVVPQPILRPYPQSDHVPIIPILGSYQASYYQETSSPIDYPINNQTVTLKLTPVAGDTIKVDIQAMPNGKYSPGQNVSYPKAVAISRIITDGTVVYDVYLNHPTTTDCGNYNKLLIYSNYNLDYYFVSPLNQPCIGARIRFTKQ